MKNDNENEKQNEKQTSYDNEKNYNNLPSWTKARDGRLL